MSDDTEHGLCFTVSIDGGDDGTRIERRSTDAGGGIEEPLIGFFCVLIAGSLI
ncbi:hypothetical protein [Acetobacter orleanensis]|uniref:hypothetical protein n=1 Tax=Acetobacter orleanensis TaxID=104099 RepID=UPI0015CE7401|nr:hypothetical protein [Acetobacter orleanensis]